MTTHGQICLDRAVCVSVCVPTVCVHENIMHLWYFDSLTSRVHLLVRWHSLLPSTVSRASKYLAKTFIIIVTSTMDQQLCVCVRVCYNMISTQKWSHAFSPTLPCAFTPSLIVVNRCDLINWYEESTTEVWLRSIKIQLHHAKLCSEAMQQV